MTAALPLTVVGLLLLLLQLLSVLPHPCPCRLKTPSGGGGLLEGGPAWSKGITASTTKKHTRFVGEVRRLFVVRIIEGQRGKGRDRGGKMPSTCIATACSQLCMHHCLRFSHAARAPLLGPGLGFGTDTATGSTLFRSPYHPTRQESPVLTARKDAAKCTSSSRARNKQQTWIVSKTLARSPRPAWSLEKASSS